MGASRIHFNPIFCPCEKQVTAQKSDRKTEVSLYLPASRIEPQSLESLKIINSPSRDYETFGNVVSVFIHIMFSYTFHRIEFFNLLLRDV